MKKTEKAVSWVVYLMTLYNKTGVNAVCEQGEWDEMELARPGYHTLIQSGIRSEGEAERAAYERIVAKQDDLRTFARTPEILALRHQTLVRLTMKRRARGLVRRITSMDLPSIFSSSRLTRRAGLTFASPRIFLCAPILESPHNASPSPRLKSD